MRSQATLWLSLVVCLPGLALAQGPAQNPDAFARQILTALAANDRQALESLSIDQAEFKKYIWPTVATNVTGGQMTRDKFYAMYSASSHAALKEHLTNTGGKKLELVKISTDSAKQYKGYRLLPNPEMTVRNQGGQEQTLKLGSALLEHDGDLKVASYYRAPTATRAQQ